MFPMGILSIKGFLDAAEFRQKWKIDMAVMMRLPEPNGNKRHRKGIFRQCVSALFCCLEGRSMTSDFVLEQD